MVSTTASPPAGGVGAKRRGVILPVSSTRAPKFSSRRCQPRAHNVVSLALQKHHPNCARRQVLLQKRLVPSLLHVHILVSYEITGSFGFPRHVQGDAGVGIG